MFSKISTQPFARIHYNKSGFPELCE